MDALVGLIIIDRGVGTTRDDVMGKRRHAGGLNDALQVLRSQVATACEIQKLVPASTAPNEPIAAKLPAGLAGLSTFDSIDGMSTQELFDLRKEIVEARKRTEEEARNWDDLGKHLKSALDAALLVNTLRAGVNNCTKRRRISPGDEEDDAEPGRSDENFVPEEHNYEKEKDPIEEVVKKEDPVEVQTPEDLVKDESTQNFESEMDISDIEPQKEEYESESEALTARGSRESQTKSDPLAVGRQVAFKLPKSQVDEWIQCEVTRVWPNGQRFELRDPEPDENGNPGKTYQCRLRDIMPLPTPDQQLKPLPSGAIVLALYPETTAFYKARVSSYSAKRGIYFLRFEGEEDAHKEIEVSDMHVLPIPRARRG